jgi:hypothetical protein
MQVLETVITQKLHDITSIKLKPMQDTYEPNEPESKKPEIADATLEIYDSLISAGVMLPKGEILIPAKGIVWKHGAAGILLE